MRFTAVRQKCASIYPSRENRLNGKPVLYKVFIPISELEEYRRDRVPKLYPTSEPHTKLLHSMLFGIWNFGSLHGGVFERRIAEIAFPELHSLDLGIHANDLPPYEWYMPEQCWSDSVEAVHIEEFPKEWFLQKSNPKWNRLFR